MPSSWELTFTNHAHSSFSALNILQWNCRGARGRLPQLQYICSSQDIICLQETLLTPHDRFAIRNFNIIRSDISDPGLRGVCILINNNIIFNAIDLGHFRHPSVELLGIVLTLYENHLSSSMSTDTLTPLSPLSGTPIYLLSVTPTTLRCS